MENDQFVLTPRGWWPRSNVHHVKHGHHIDGKDGHLKIVHTESGEIIKDLGKIKITKDKAGKHIPGIENPEIRIESSIPQNGWICDAHWENKTGNPISWFKARMIVPPHPSTDHDQVVTIYNALSPEPAYAAILQPVLSWFKGNWYLINYYVVGKNMFHGDLIGVKPGDIVFGIMSLISSDGKEFNYYCYNDPSFRNGLTVTRIDELVHSYCTLEIYHPPGFPGAFTDYPNTNLITFDYIEMKVKNNNVDNIVTVNWEGCCQVTDFGQSCDANNLLPNGNFSPGGSVFIHYGKGPAGKKCP